MPVITAETPKYNSEQITRHHFEAYGFFSSALKDYVEHGLFPLKIGTPEYQAVLRIDVGGSLDGGAVDLGLEVVEQDRIVAGGGERVGQVGADEPRAAHCKRLPEPLLHNRTSTKHPHTPMARTR